MEKKNDNEAIFVDVIQVAPPPTSLLPFTPSLRLVYTLSAKTGDIYIFCFQY